MALWLYLTDATKHAAMLPISKDKATLEGYLQKWKHFKDLLSMGSFVQLLLPISYLSLNWQVEISATSLVAVYINLKEARDNVTTMKVIHEKGCTLELLYVKEILDKLKDDGTYQGNAFTHIDEVKASIKNDAVEFCDSLLECLHPGFDEQINNLQESLSNSLNKELWLKSKSVTEKKLCNESSCLESSESEDEGSQGDIEIYEEEHHLFSFAVKNTDIIVEKFRTPLETSGYNIPALKTEFLILFNYVKKH